MTNLTLQPPEQQEERKGDKEQAVIDHVLDRLGTPKDLFRVDAKPLWADRFRVNVYCALTNDSVLNDVRITDSFHVTVGEDGIQCVPPIARKY